MRTHEMRELSLWIEKTHPMLMRVLDPPRHERLSTADEWAAYERRWLMDAMDPIMFDDDPPTVPGTPATPQPKDPTEGGSVGPEKEDRTYGEPQKNPDPGIEQHPHRAPNIPPMEIVP